jgi:predicted nuclease with TOPRIM domain
MDFIIKERQVNERELIEARAETEHLRKRVAELEAIPRAPDDKKLEKLHDLVKRVEKLLKARNAEIRNLKERLSSLENKEPLMSKALHRQVLSLLHPDRAHGDEAMRKRLEKAFQEFSAVKLMRAGAK